MALLDEYAEAYIVNGVNKGFFAEDLDTKTFGKAVNALIFTSIKDSLKAKDPAAARAMWTQCLLKLLVEGMSK
jgi:hypothetical protein